MGKPVTFNATSVAALPQVSGAAPRAPGGRAQPAGRCDCSRCSGIGLVAVAFLLVFKPVWGQGLPPPSFDAM